MLIIKVSSPNRNKLAICWFWWLIAFFCCPKKLHFTYWKINNLTIIRLFKYSNRSIRLLKIYYYAHHDLITCNLILQDGTSSYQLTNKRQTIAHLRFRLKQKTVFWRLLYLYLPNADRRVDVIQSSYILYGIILCKLLNVFTILECIRITRKFYLNNFSVSTIT